VSKNEYFIELAFVSRVITASSTERYPDIQAYWKEAQ
jgi:hypothetical protein